MFTKLLLTSFLLAAPTLLSAESHAIAPPPVSSPPPVPAQPGPPPIPQMSVYVVVNGQQAGPFGAPELMQMAQAGALTPDSLVWQNGMGDWAKAGTVGPLMALLGSGAQITPGQQPGQVDQQAFDAKAYMTGTWVAEPTMVPVDGTIQGMANMTVEYKSDGSVTGNGSVNFNTEAGPTTIFMEIQGTYQAQASGQNMVSLAVVTQVTLIANGQNQQNQLNETAMIQVVDQNTLIDDEGTKWHRQ